MPVAITSDSSVVPVEQDDGFDPEAAVGLLLRNLRASPDGLTSAEAQRRLLQYGPNELRRRRGLRWPAELAEQLTHPLALLLWAAAALSFAVGNGVIAIAVLLVIFLNAAFALAQELQAERAVEALSRYLPQKAIRLARRPAKLAGGGRAGARRRGGPGGGRARSRRCPLGAGGARGRHVHSHRRAVPGSVWPVCGSACTWSEARLKSSPARTAPACVPGCP
jgi:hypothetical protein